MQQTPVIVYSADWCAFCKMAKGYLVSKNVPFKEVDVERDHDAARELVSKTGQAGIPVLEIGEEVIIGFDRLRIDEAIDKYKLAGK